MSKPHEDADDAAVMAERESEPSRPFVEYVKDRHDHCWHQDVMGGSVWVTSSGYGATVNEHCCWCPERRTRHISGGTDAPKQHGPYQYGNWTVVVNGA